MKTTYSIGIENIKERQILFIVLSIILITVNLFFFLLDKSTVTLILSIVTLLLLFVFNFLGSFICRVFLSDDIIRIENLFRKNTNILASEFEKIVVIFPYASVYRISFKDGRKFYFAINSKEAFKTIFSINHNNYALNLTQEVQKKIRNNSM